MCGASPVSAISPRLGTAQEVQVFPHQPYLPCDVQFMAATTVNAVSVLELKGKGQHMQRCNGAMVPYS